MQKHWHLAVLVLLAACGGSPSAPTQTNPAPGGGLPFAAGAAVIQFTGPSVECGDVKNPQAGTSVGIAVTLQPDASGWTASNETKTLTVRFERGPAPTAPGSQFAIGITGTARGSAEDDGVLFDPRIRVPPNGTRITFADNAAISGSMPSSVVSDFTAGAIDGAVTYSRNGVTSTCAPGLVRWSMTHLPS